MIYNINNILALFALFVLAIGLSTGSTDAQSLQQDPGPDGIVSVEAENFDANVENGGQAWVQTGPTEGFTGTAGMWAPNGQGGHSSDFLTNSERLDYEINFVKTGIHYVWILAWGASGSDDSCHVGLDGDATLSSQMSGWNNNYQWSNNRYQAAGPSRVNVTSTGPHTLNIWVREDGCIIDKIVLTSNPNFSLSGNEPGPPESFWGAILNAYGPDPADGALHASTWANLSWSPGDTAATHDVYLSESFEDVNNRVTETFRGSHPTSSIVVGFLGAPHPDGLVQGTTYYWRVDEVEADGTTKYEGPVWSFSVPPLNAYDPSPQNGAVYQDTDMPLTWSPGLGVELQTLYFGDNFEDVTSGAVPWIARTTSDYTPPAPLEYNKTYYWRVDQLNPPITTRGQVWSFRTLPEIPIADPNLVGWWKFEAGKDTRVVDWSGQGNHGTISGAANVQWVTGMYNLGLEFLGDYQGYVELPPGMVTTGAGSVLMWINTTQGNDEGMLWYGSAVEYGNGYGGENEIHINIDDPGAGQIDFFLEEDGSGSDITINGPEVGGQGWTHVAATWDVAGGCRLFVNGVKVGSAAHNTNVQKLAIIRLGSAAEDNVFYDGLMDDVRLFDRALTADEIVEVISEGEDPRRPGTPQPGNGAAATLIEAASLSWSTGQRATEHDVYFGMDRDAVANADASDATGIYRGRQSATTYAASEDVEWDSGPYYWRIDEIAADGTVTSSGVWS
ncbi:MAG: LamG-like jellyroll fold domain-containing protein, partial [Planctomycetota bacterium]